ncbi:hypothetical protein P1P68_37120 [Streptomyces scabiei]|uniref:hypothetical protein n=1 Tax=Streptomyces scabiei TaxID=1930 RepID=UPI0029906E18|nr:hypothetical protein [Streptomyces scabiei]MDW8810274.1 hypothetical protein [Streptomyces scabiei]
MSGQPAPLPLGSLAAHGSVPDRVPEQRQIPLAATVISALPILIFYAVAQRSIIKGVSAGALT